MSDTQLFEKQKRIYPKRTWGRYRKLKWVAMIATLSIYYLTPWLRWDRGPNAPDQAILIDIPHSRAYFFFIEIWPQEVYYFTGLLILAAIGLFFVTSLFGRVWCGYTCPQTVWTDLFVWVERIIQGDRNARMKLDKQPRFSLERIWKKTATHSIWLVVGALTGGAWVFYFNDAPTLMENILHGELPTAVLGWIAALTLSTYIMAGYAREQVCTHMCPYARFQSAMFDKDSLIIAYDNDRGETRGKLKEKPSTPNQGDCIDCSLCVQVCPVGIDIRDGLQMECIACGLCVDACNDVMEKIDLPQGLIRYDTEHNKQARRSGKLEQFTFLRWRTLGYTLILAAVGGIMLFSLLTHSPLELHVLHDRNPLFVTLSDGSIRNGYDIKILNKTHDDKSYSLTLVGPKNAEIRVQGAGELEQSALSVYADSVAHYRIFVTTAKPPTSRVKMQFTLQDNASSEQDTMETIFISGKQ
ncbi:MAG: cytochrome c oxidase accessory protein CcoG [Rickettsiales bacterium]|nr:cytochrome c oxidase accessory protein CcoG [Rickettsiales bacterium]